jgi:hypothetical protein
MAKDPAFLFYSSDFLTGTTLMNDEQVGKYIRLLCLQHQKGRLSEKDMLKICLTYDKDIFEKFAQDAEGNFFNQRLEIEATKRKAYSDSRRANREKKQTDMSNICESYVPHMENENENRNDNGIELKLKESLNEIYIDQQRPKWGHIDFDFELNSFLEKVRGSPDDYLTRDNSGIKLAFQYQLRNAKPKGKNGKPTDKATEHANSLLEGFKRRNG